MIGTSRISRVGEGVKHFLAGRLKRTVGFRLSENMADAIAASVHEALKKTDFGDEKKVLGILVLARCEPDGYFTIQPGKSPLRPSVRLRKGWSIVPNFAKVLEGFWTAKLKEGREAGWRVGSCSFSGAAGELVTAYCKAWPWAFPTWTCPLPNGGDEQMLIESVALSSESYEALTLGASVFNRLTHRVSSLITPELFSPADNRPGKEQAKRRRD